MSTSCANHPDTLASRNNLARGYQDAGRLEEALPLLKRTLADRERRAVIELAGRLAALERGQ